MVTMVTPSNQPAVALGAQSTAAQNWKRDQILEKGVILEFGIRLVEVGTEAATVQLIGFD